MKQFEGLTLEEKIRTLAMDIYASGVAIEAPDVALGVEKDADDHFSRMAQYLFRCGWRTKTDEPYKTKFFGPHDNVNHPAHYTDGKIEVIDYIQDKDFNFCRGNAIKYISRAGKKDKAKEIEDLQKAVLYLNKEIERLQTGD